MRCECLHNVNVDILPLTILAVTRALLDILIHFILLIDKVVSLLYSIIFYFKAKHIFAFTHARSDSNQLNELSCVCVCAIAMHTTFVIRQIGLAL